MSTNASLTAAGGLCARGPRPAETNVPQARARIIAVAILAVLHRSLITFDLYSGISMLHSSARAIGRGPVSARCEHFLQGGQAEVDFRQAGGP